MKNIFVAFVFFSIVVVYGCSQNDATTNSKEKKTDSISAAQKKNDLLRVADSMNAPDQTKTDTSKTK